MPISFSWRNNPLSDYVTASRGEQGQHVFQVNFISRHGPDHTRVCTRVYTQHLHTCTVHTVTTIKAFNAQPCLSPSSTLNCFQIKNENIACVMYGLQKNRSPMRTIVDIYVILFCKRGGEWKRKKKRTENKIQPSINRFFVPRPVDSPRRSTVLENLCGSNYRTNPFYPTLSRVSALSLEKGRSWYWAGISREKYPVCFAISMPVFGDERTQLLFELPLSTMRSAWGIKNS